MVIYTLFSAVTPGFEPKNFCGLKHQSIYQTASKPGPPSTLYLQLSQNSAWTLGFSPSVILEGVVPRPRHLLSLVCGVSSSSIVHLPICCLLFVSGINMLGRAFIQLMRAK